MNIEELPFEIKEKILFTVSKMRYDDVMKVIKSYKGKSIIGTYDGNINKYCVMCGEKAIYNECFSECVKCSYMDY